MAEREVQRLAKILGNSIVERRKILGMTQIELANRLDMLLTPYHASKTGTSPPGSTGLKKWRRFWSVPLRSFFEKKTIR